MQQKILCILLYNQFQESWALTMRDGGGQGQFKHSLENGCIWYKPTCFLTSDEESFWGDILRREVDWAGWSYWVVAAPAKKPQTKQTT